MSAGLKPGWSIRKRLTRRVLALALGAWGVAIGLTLLLISYEINEILDEELQALAEANILIMDASPGGVIPRSLGISPDSGERVLRVLRMDDPVPDGPWPGLTSDGFHTVADWRVLRLSGENAVTEVAHRLSWRREEVLESAGALLLLILPMIALLIWGLGRSLRGGLAPLDDLAADIVARGPSDLSSVPETELPAELRPLVAALNRYIRKIDALRSSERRFLGHASHELRTPVAVIRARLEVSEAPEVREVLPLLDSLARRVERFLQLSRSEEVLDQGPADLVRILHLLIREIRTDGRHPIRFDDDDRERLMIAADPDGLAIVLRNLLENALEHGSGPVHIRIARDCLTISNPSASGFEQQPFVKRAGSGGLGLGLSIVDQLAAAMGIKADYVHAEGMAQVMLHFPPAHAGDQMD